ncbi:MAG: HAMP domain-containing sensor histidine kinase, partial [Campylobacterota bacterium]|nr:HAMP domain-containing sensor histidine kinase [Campylobacterota bacterium]
DTTESTICNQKILQDRNKQELISRELSHKSIIKDKMIALQSRQAQMGEMIGAIAHQWRQPLNIISTGIQNLKYDYMEGKLEDEAYIKKFIDKNKKTVKFMSSTIDDFRNFFKPEKEKRDFRINEPIHHIIDILNPTLLHHKITIEATQLSNIVVSGYPNELGQVLINIINNAKDALFENHIEDKYIKIYTIQDQECISIVIEDNARGIPEEIIDTIFDPYFSTKLDKNGTGLGLYMSKIIIEDHMSGRITVKNIAEGAQFIISLKKN